MTLLARFVARSTRVSSVRTVPRCLATRSALATRMYTSDSSAEKARSKSTIGIFNWRATALFVATGAGLMWYFRQEKERVKAAQEEQFKTKSYGKPKLGGPFELVDHHGNPRTEKDFEGKYAMYYFGFTNCPDICPDELDKMSEVVDNLDKEAEFKDAVIPVFITCDPQRDSIEHIREYVKDFHPKLVGLTGTHEQIGKAARAYRVYYSKPPTGNDGEDYLVDHSIFFYLMDPNGKFVDFYGKDFSANYVTNSIREHMREYLAAGGKLSS